VASQSEAHRATSARLLEIRFPAHLGRRRLVLAHDEALAVADAQQDPPSTTAWIRSPTHDARHLCAPLRARSGTSG